MLKIFPSCGCLHKKPWAGGVPGPGPAGMLSSQHAGCPSSPALMERGLWLACTQLSDLVFTLLVRPQVGPPSWALGLYSWLPRDLPSPSLPSTNRFDSISMTWHNPPSSQPPHRPGDPSINTALATVSAFISTF